MSLIKLLQLSNKRKISDKQFLSLFDQLIKNEPINSGTFIDLLEDSINENYLILVSIQYEIFWESLPKLPLNQQVRLVKKLENKISLIRDIEPFLESFTKYCNYVIGENNEDLVNGIIFNWDILINSYTIKDLPLVRTFMNTFSSFLATNNYSKQLEYCNNKFKTNFNKTLKKSNLKNLTLNVKLKSYQNYESLKIFYWFNQFFHCFGVPSNNIIFNHFNTMFGSFSTSASTSSDNLDKELTCSKLIHSIFNGIHLSSKTGQSAYITENWINFLYSRLPRLITLYKLENLEDVLGKVFEHETLRDELRGMQGYKENLVKSLIFNKVLSIKGFHKFPEIKFNQQNLIHEMSSINSIENFNDILNDKLYNLNCEFISIEESNLISYFDDILTKLDFSMSKQSELTKSLQNLMGVLINEQNFEKLNRLILLVLKNHKLFNVFLFNLDSPQVLSNIITLIDSDAFKINDDNESSFQEVYSYFGNLILFVLKVSKRVKFDFKVKNSFFLTYLSNFKSRFYNLTNNYDESSESDKIVVDNYKSLSYDWIQSLFNDSEGLSDEIIKSINVKQIHQLIPIIYQQAIMSVIENKIDFKILTNGLDYLSQNFLMTCSFPIVNWLITRISLKNQNLNTYVKILNDIINLIENISKESNNELKLTADILLENIMESVSTLRDINIDDKIILSKIDNYAPKESQVKLNCEVLNFQSFEESLFKVFNGNLNEANLPLINYFVNYQDSLLQDLLVNLNSNTFKSTNENLKYVIDFIIFINISSSVKTAEDKKFWINAFTNKISTLTYDAALGSKISLDNHYSGAFNDNNQDDESLFDTISVEYGWKKAARLSIGLAQFNLIWNKFNSMGKSLNLVHEKLLNDLNSFEPIWVV